jgi:exo-1,4-beta-D-glucosaminidase
VFTVVAENKSDSVAFMVHPRITRGKGGDDVVPVLWSDNYFSLLPGEKMTVTASFDLSALDGATAELVVEGWNVEATAP